MMASTLGRRYTPWLLVLVLLFCFRVFAQFVQLFWI
jgi:hypothetical protein